MTRKLTQNVLHITLQLLLIGILIAASFLIMKPFIPSLIWAATIVAATWPLMLKVESWLWGKRSLAVAVMTIIMLVLLIVPLTLAIVTVVENSDKIAEWVKSIQTQPLPALPHWISGIPILGSKLAAVWESLRSGPEGISARLAPYAGKLLNWFLYQAGGVGMILIQFLLTIVIAAIFYSKGEAFAAGIIRFARRLGGNNGEIIAILTVQTVRGVALGVVGAALIQSFLAGIGLAVAGVPFAVVLTGIMFILTIAQIGPVPVLIPAAIWLYYNDQTAWAIALFVWTGFVGISDNIIRPFLIRKGADLPLLLIFAGVIGGLITFGVVGLFIGPVVLAISYKLLEVWVESPEVNLEKQVEQ